MVHHASNQHPAKHNRRWQHLVQAIAEHLKRAGDPHTFLDAILPVLLEFTGLEVGWLLLKNGEVWELAAVRGIPTPPQSPLWPPCRCSRLAEQNEWSSLLISDCDYWRTRGHPELEHHVSVPLQIEGRILGILNAVWPGKRALPSQIAGQLEAAALLLAIALDQLDRQRVARQQAERLKRSHRLLHVLGTTAVQVRDALNLNEILHTVGENLKQVGIQCAVALVEPNEQKLTLRYTSAREQRSVAPGTSNTGWTVPWSPDRWFSGAKQNQAVLVQQGITVLRRAFPDIPLHVLEDLLEQTNIGKANVLYAPLQAGGQIVGLLFAWGPKWEEDDLAPFTLFCAELGAMIRAVQLGEQLQARRVREQDLLLRHARLLLSADNEEYIIQATLEIVREALDVSFAALLVPDSSSASLVVRGEQTWAPVERVPVEGSWEGHVFVQERPTQWNNHSHPNAPHIVAAAIAPLLGMQAPCGVLCAYSDQPRTFDEAEMRLLTLIAGQTATALDRLQTRQAATRAEVQFRRLFDSVPVGLYRSTPDGRVVSVNRALVEMLGYPDRETLLNTPASALYVDPADRERWKENVDRQNVVRDFEMRLRRYDGSPIWVRDTARVVRDRTGRVLYYDGIVEDITAHKQAQQEREVLLAALERRAAYLEALNAVIVAAAEATDLPSLLATVLDHVLQALGLEMGGVWLADEAIVRGLPEEFARRIATTTRKAGLTLSSSVVVDNWHTLTPDVPHAVLQPVMIDFGVGASVSVSFVEGQGGLNVAASQPRRWKKEEILFLEAIGRQLGAAAGRIRLLQEAQQRAQLATRLAELAETLSRPQRINDVIPIIGRGIRELSGADRAAIYLFGAGNTITCPWFYGLSSNYITTVLRETRRLPGWYLTVDTAPVLIPDTEALPEENPLRHLARAEGYRALALWPLTYEGHTIAALGCYYNIPRRWSSVEREIIESFCRQAALAITNARFFEDEQRRRQTMAELLEMVHKVGASLDFKEVLIRIARHTAHICRAYRCSIFLLEEGEAGPIACPFMSQFADGHVDIKLWKRFKGEAKVSVNTLPSLEPAVQQQRAVIINDVNQAEPALQEWVKPYDITSLLVVPLVTHGQTIGVMVLDQVEPDHHFTPEQADLAMAIGDRVAVSIENASLYTAQQQLTRQLTTLHRVTASLLETLDRETLVDRVLEGAFALTSKAKRATLFLVETSSGDIYVARTRGHPPPTLSPHNSPGTQAALRAIRARRPVFTPAVDVAPSKVVRVEDLRHPALAVPLIVEERPLGVLLLEGGPFKGEDVEVMAAFAATAAAALHNALLHAQVQELAMTDALTGIYNRRALFLLGQREVERAKRFGRTLTAIMFDLDHFKRVNDMYGHTVGDQVLAQVARLCQSELRQTDLLGRYGGEEFVALLPETEVPAAWQTAERLRQRVARTPIETARGTIRITISLGVALLSGELPSLENLMERADQALYAAKQAGRNCTRIWPNRILDGETSK